MEKHADVDTVLAEHAQTLRQRYSPAGRVLLVQTPQFLFHSLNREVVRNRGCYAYPPTGLQWLANSLAGRGLHIAILDLNYEFLRRAVDDDAFRYDAWLDILDEWIAREEPSIVGVSDTSVYCDVSDPAFPLTAVLRRLREQDRFILLAGGPTATNEYPYYLEEDLCHFVVEGEGESKVSYLFDHLFPPGSGSPPAAGVHFFAGGELRQSKGAHHPVELKGTLVETYASLPIERYREVGSLNPYSRMSGKDKPYGVFQLNRGCRADCRFCGVRDFMGRGLRQFPPQDVLEEIRYLVEERGVRHLELLDDDFIGMRRHRGALVELLEGMARLRGAHDFSWSANNGLVASSLDGELLALLRDSGCIGFKIGIESGNREMFRRSRKPGNLEALRKAGRLLAGFPELNVGGNYIIGLFGEESFGQMLDTFRFARAMRLDWSSFTVFQVTSSARARAEGFARAERGATDFIPAKDTATRELDACDGIVTGPAVFTLPPSLVPSPAQLSHIWFAFNLVANYIDNTNLQPGGRPEKFTAWVEAVQDVYPHNPYMRLFTALGYALQGMGADALAHLDRARGIVEESENWRRRFTAFGLDTLLSDFPSRGEEVYARLGALRRPFEEFR